MKTQPGVSQRAVRPSEAVVSEQVIPAWERLGWDRPPRNGREWALVREGKPQPVRNYLGGKDRKCRRCGSRAYKRLFGSNYTCKKCKYAANESYAKRHPEKVKAWQKKSWERTKRQVVEAPADGGPTPITRTWFHMHRELVGKRVVRGERFVVLDWGVPAFAVVSIDDLRALPRRKPVRSNP